MGFQQGLESQCLPAQELSSCLSGQSLLGFMESAVPKPLCVSVRDNRSPSITCSSFFGKGVSLPFGYYSLHGSIFEPLQDLLPGFQEKFTSLSVPFS